LSYDQRKKLGYAKENFIDVSLVFKSWARVNNNKKNIVNECLKDIF